MKDENGLTLIELLAVISIIAIISVFLFSILLNGFTVTERTTIKQKVQQEGNYITETIRKEYLTSSNSNIILKVEGNNKSLLLNDNVISSGYDINIYDNLGNKTNEYTIKRNESNYLHIEITKDSFSYEVKTVLSKLIDKE